MLLQAEHGTLNLQQYCTKPEITTAVVVKQCSRHLCLNIQVVFFKKAITCTANQLLTCWYSSMLVDVHQCSTGTDMLASQSKQWLF